MSSFNPSLSSNVLTNLETFATLAQFLAKFPNPASLSMDINHKVNVLDSLISLNSSKEEELWNWPEISPTEFQVRTMIGLVIEKIVYITMSNHMYTFNNEVRIQNDCGPTGLMITGIALDVFMLWWDGKFLDKLKEMKLSIFRFTSNPDRNLPFHHFTFRSKDFIFHKITT